MIITRTPLRISFVGGGSDLAAFYTESEGAVLSASINKYIYIATSSPFENSRLSLRHSCIESVDHFKELQHPIAREVLNHLKFQEKIDINVMSDLPHGTGLGSSSAFTVSMLQNIYARKGQYPVAPQLAELASMIEIEKLNEPIGKQDQYASSLGGINVLRFHKDHSVSAESLDLPRTTRKKMLDHLLLVYTGINRKASSILTEQKNNMSSIDKRKVLERMVELVTPLATALLAGNMEEFGGILDANWTMKQTLAKSVSNEEIDGCYVIARKNGAFGGKLLGAGGGGFLLFVAKPEDHHKILNALPRLKQLDFEFDFEGTQIVYPNIERSRLAS